MQRDTLEFAFRLLLWSVHILAEGLMNGCLEAGSNGLFPCTNILSNESTFMTWSVQRTDGNTCKIALDFDTYEFSSTCDPRFSLHKMGLTGFLNIRNIQQADNGNYSCEYSYHGGTDATNFNICVSESPTESNKGYSILLGCAVSISMLSILILILWRLLVYHESACRRQTENLSSHTDQGMGDVEPYSTFMQKDDGFYSVAVLSNINP